jgi:hypothetical protein
MKLHALNAAVLAPLFLFGPMTQDGGQTDLKTQVAEQGRELAELRIELTETRDLLDMTMAYIKDQAAAAKALQASLADVEAQGFTAGINARSRETLLTSWRGYLGDQQSGVPKAKAKPKAKK